MLTKSARRNKIKLKTRKRIKGTQERPRLTVYRSNSEIYAQLVNDLTGHTLLSVSSLKLKSITGNKVEKAKQVGITLANTAKAAGFESVVFDRSGYLSHGRIKSLADGAREGGLIF